MSELSFVPATYAVMCGKDDDGFIRPMLIDSEGKLVSSVSGPFSYKGVWNADTNNPALASGVGSKGDWYLVTVAGTTNLDGITDWNVGDNAVFNGSTWNHLDNSEAGTTESISFTLDGNGFALETGIKGDIIIPYDLKITGYTIVANQVGSVVIDLWKDTYANFPPTNADSITAAAPITVTTAEKAQDIVLTGWSKSANSGEIIRINVDSITDIQKATIILNVVKE